MSEAHGIGLTDGVQAAADPAPGMVEPQGQGELLQALTAQRAEIISLNQRLAGVEGYVQYLSTQQTSQELLMERNTRASALDLAIKALPEGQRTSDAITLYAAAFVEWMRGGH